MKKTVLFSAVCIALLSLSLVSCEKIKTETFSPIGIWKMTKFEFIVTEGGIIVHQAIELADKDNSIEFVFSANGVCTLTYSGSPISATYVFSEDFTTLQITTPSDRVVYEVQKIDNDNIVVKLNIPNGVGEGGKQYIGEEKIYMTRQK